MNPEISNFAPPNAANTDTSQSTNNYQGTEKERLARSVQAAKSVRAVLHSVITTRAELATYLAQHSMQLLTSAVEYTSSQDFVSSSYILYQNHNNFLEPLSDFLKRYPDYQPSIDAILEKGV